MSMKRLVGPYRKGPTLDVTPNRCPPRGASSCGVGAFIIGGSETAGPSAMELDDFLDVTDEAVKRVYEHDRSLIGSGASERSVAHRFAVYLEASLPKMNIDCEYGLSEATSSPEDIPAIKGCEEKKEPGWIVPDILVHARNSKDEDNLAVFEVRCGSELDECDKAKLGCMTSKEGRYGFGFGMGVEFYPDHCSRVLFIDGEQHGEPITSSPVQDPTNIEPSSVGGGETGPGSRTAIEESADILQLDKAARKKIQGLTPDEALALYDSLKDKSITELTDAEYAERLVLGEKMSDILRDRRKKQKP